MAFSVESCSNIRLLACNHFRRSGRLDVLTIISRSHLPVVTHTISLSPREHAILTCATAGDGGSTEFNRAQPSLSEDMEMANCKANSGEGYIGLFVQMLGLANNLVDRELAVMTLWRYSNGGRDSIDGIMKFPGCVNLVLNLLKSDNPSICEAVAGLLHNISSVYLYRKIIAANGVIEEITWLLHQSSLTLRVKELSLCTLWNLSIDESLRMKLAHTDLISLFIKFLDNNEIKVQEAAVGILANLSLSPINHHNIVEAGIIPKLANIFKNDAEGLEIIRKSVKTALIELSKNDNYKILIIEEGLIRVPIIGAAAYKSFRPHSNSWPSLPDGTNLERTSRSSKYGATELLLGLSIHEKNINLEESKINAIVGRSQQQFLAQIHAISNDQSLSESASSLKQQHTLLPWIDGVARLVLFLGLEDTLVITRAAYSIADSSISEHLRISFKEAGAIKPLVQLLSHDDKSVQDAAVYALKRLSQSYEVCQAIEAEDIVHPLFNMIKRTNVTESALEKIIDILNRVMDPGKYMGSKLQDKLVSGSDKMANSLYSTIKKDASLRTAETSMLELISRERAINLDVVNYLIKILKKSPPALQSKIASIFEYLTSFEPYAMILATSDVESGIHAVFQNLSSKGTQEVIDNQLDLNTMEAEEIGLAIAAVSRLLSKLLEFEKFCHSVNAAQFESLLCDALKSRIPLHAKEWVAACLMKLESTAASGSKMSSSHIQLEVIIYESIPRLIEQLGLSVSIKSRETAALELYELISNGGVECSRAIATAGGIFSLVKLLMEEGRGDEALEACLSILYNLSMDDENHPAMVAAGIIPALKKIVLLKGPHWTRALRLLRTLPT